MASEQERQIDLTKYDKNMRAESATGFSYDWHSPNEPPTSLAGLAWFAQEGLYRRLPRKPRHKLPEAVDRLADMTAGAQIRFQSKTRLVAVRVKLRGPANMCHMPATGQCGFDLYVGPPLAQRYISTTRYDHTCRHYQVLLFERMRLAAELRNFTLNFPLLQAVDEVLVGLEPGAEIRPPPSYGIAGPIVFYGTSITHGGCASRPGMAYTNILGRRMNAAVINLGFGGSGRGEIEVARTIAEIVDPACFVLDYEANANGAEEMRRTLPAFIKVLREAHAEIPIVVVSKIPYAQENFNDGPRQERLACRGVESRTVEDLRRAGDRRIWFLDMGQRVRPGIAEGTVDGVPPNDLGFSLMADVFEPFLRGILPSLG